MTDPVEAAPPRRGEDEAATAAVRSGTLTVEAHARACLDRIAARDEAVCAWALLEPERALAQARALDGAGSRGVLHGLTLGVKDVIQTRDMPTRYNSPLYEVPPPTPDAPCVALLRDAGALLLGKTTTVEFAAIGRPPATRNPHDPTRTPGGSSSGSAAAVADGQVRCALGTQTGGSVIRPAAFCGVWGMKPTWGLISNEGCKRFAPSLDTLGWFGRSARDLARLLDALAPDPAPVAALDLAGARIGVCRTPVWERAEPATRAALGAAVEALRREGAEVDMLELPPALESLPQLHRDIMRAEGRVSFQAERTHLDGAMRDMAEGVDVIDDAALRTAYDTAAEARARFDALAEPFDAVLAPSAAGEAPIGLASTGDLSFQGLWTLLHVPCVNVPGWRGPAGMPVGLTLLGRRYSDRRVLGVAAALGDLRAC